MPKRAVVLIVEDEPLVRLNAADMVEDAGWEPLEAADAQDAVAILDAASVDVLFSDINMPGEMDGVQLASYVHQRWPQIHLVITSGKRYVDEIVLPDHATFLPKPYGIDDLVGVIGRKLNERH